MARKIRHLLRFPGRRPEDPSSFTDQDLVARIQKGDQQAWSVFLERYTDLIYTRAREYSRSAPGQTGVADLEDEVAELYLFMATTLQRSLASFRGACKPGTWVHSIIDNRPYILKAYLRQKNPHRAEVRLPKVLQSRPAIDQEIFRRLVWGLDPTYIALDLNVPMRQCAEIEDLLAEHSPRVYARIQGNRQAQQPHLRLEFDEDRPALQVADPGPDPHQHLEDRQLQEAVQQGLHQGLERLSTPERRILILLYNHHATAAQILDLAADQSLGLGEIPNINRVYYLKDRALGTILDAVLEELGNLEGGVPNAVAERRTLLKHIEDLVREQGIPTPGQTPDALSL